MLPHKRKSQNPMKLIMMKIIRMRQVSAPKVATTQPSTLPKSFKNCSLTKQLEKLLEHLVVDG